MLWCQNAQNIKISKRKRKCALTETGTILKLVSGIWVGMGMTVVRTVGDGYRCLSPYRSLRRDHSRGLGGRRPRVSSGQRPQKGEVWGEVSPPQWEGLRRGVPLLRKCLEFFIGNGTFWCISRMFLRLRCLSHGPTLSK